MKGGRGGVPGYGQGEDEYAERSGEAGEAEEQFLHKILMSVLGQEAEYSEAPLTAAQEAEFAATAAGGRPTRRSSARVLGGIVNTVGRAVQGVRGAVNSPQGRALIDAVAPLGRSGAHRRRRAGAR